ncbi:MAG TPA: J domain-containing protein [Caulobacteraceae bacterium]|nr:J domain-containing protein [Caulobacteraceae bacterium]
MSGAFQYRPKFVDIRVRPPVEGEEAQAEDVHALKPGEVRCDHPGCLRAATARAPKSRILINDHYHFCQPHAADYNKQWDFFAGMSEGEIRAHQDARATGERPTWSFKASNRSREAAAAASRDGRAFSDPFGIFGAARRRAEANEEAGRHLGKIERNALADLDLQNDAQPTAIRARYTELVKRCHPDANGGDRSAEHKLQRVIKAYKTLQKAGMV